MSGRFAGLDGRHAWQSVGMSLDSFATNYTDEVRWLCWVLWLVTAVFTALLVGRRVQAASTASARARIVLSGMLVVALVTLLALGIPWWLESNDLEPMAIRSAA